MIPDFTRIDKASLERAQCETPKPTVEAPECEPEDSGCLERAAEREKETTTIVTRAEIKVADHLKIYAAMLLSTIRNKCGANVGFAPKGNMVEVTAGKLAPEIGIEYKDEHRRDPTTYKIFNRGLQKALGFGAEF